MTPAEVRALTDDQLRVAIARALGWSRELDRIEAGVEDLPDWPRSLDACAELRREVEKRELRRRYVAALREIVDAAYPDFAYRYDWRKMNATARQHAEAALMALTSKEILSHP